MDYPFLLPFDSYNYFSFKPPNLSSRSPNRNKLPFSLTSQRPDIWTFEEKNFNCLKPAIETGWLKTPKKSSVDDLSHLGGFEIVPASLRPNPLLFEPLEIYLFFLISRQKIFSFFFSLIIFYRLKFIKEKKIWTSVSIL